MTGALGVISCGSSTTAAAAAEVLRAGGNAADAAVAAAFATAAGEPALTSLAGGGMMIHRDAATGLVETCNFFATAPGLGGKRDRSGAAPGLPPLDFRPIEVDFRAGGATQVFHVGRGAAAVPGTLPGLVAAVKRWGRLGPRDVLAPAVRMLRDGVPASEFAVFCNGILEPILKLSDLGRARYFRADGSTLVPGDTFRCPEQAHLLEEIIQDDATHVLRGEFGPGILRAFGEEAGGWITAHDLAAYHSTFAPPLEVAYGGARVYLTPAPAVGGRFIAHTLKLLAGEHLGGWDEPGRLRHIAAVFRAVSEVRALDPFVLDAPDAGARFAARLREVLRGDPPPALPEPRLPGNTTHISVVDRDGNAAGITVSHGEGNGYEIPGTGILMNNFLGEADLFPQGFFRFTPGERLHTMMSPVIVVEPGGAVTSLGSGGANRIRTAIPQVVSGLLDQGLTVAEAVTQGRMHFEAGLLSAETYAHAEGAATWTGASELAESVRFFDRPSLFFGGVHLARRAVDGVLSGVGDPRRHGYSLVVLPG